MQIWKMQIWENANQEICKFAKMQIWKNANWKKCKFGKYKFGKIKKENFQKF